MAQYTTDSTTTTTPSPTECPFCRSTKILVPNEKASVSAYWRCESCGQMWNVSRNLPPPRSRWNRY